MRDDDLRAMQELASRVWSRAARHHPGRLAWGARLVEDTSTRVRTWTEPTGLVGWAWAEEPDHLELCLDVTTPHATDVAREMVGWFVAGAPQGPTTATVMTGDHLLLAVLEEAGFVVERGPWLTHHHLDLTRLAELPVPVPVGYRVRAVRGDEAAPRSACHRAAEAAPGRPSRATTTAYAALMATASYRADLDHVAIDAAGHWVASCLVWLDPATGVALVEPFGCAPAHRRRGLATAVSLSALHAARAAGASEAVARPRGDQGDPAARVLLRRIGFEPGERTVTLVRD